MSLKMRDKVSLSCFLLHQYIEDFGEHSSLMLATYPDFLSNASACVADADP
jgi:hypothetical protein